MKKQSLSFVDQSAPLHLRLLAARGSLTERKPSHIGSLFPIIFWCFLCGLALLWGAYGQR
jgi:hypothetical protein